MYKNLPRVIGIAGNATVGKDTFYEIAKDILLDHYTVERLAFADALKNDLKDFVLTKFGLEIFNLSRVQKELLRPLMVAYGKAKRDLTKGMCWIDQVQELIYASQSDIVFITDVRYAGESGNEYKMIKDNGGALIYIKKISSSGDHYTPPANEEERVNNKQLMNCADIEVIWDDCQGDSDKISQLKPIVKKALLSLSNGL